MRPVRPTTLFVAAPHEDGERADIVGPRRFHVEVIDAFEISTSPAAGAPVTSTVVGVRMTKGTGAA